MTVTQHGPICDVCRKYITGIDGGLMDIWSIAGCPAFTCHDRCRDGMKDLKILLLEAYGSEMHSWYRWLRAGNSVTDDEINGSMGTALMKAIDQYRTESGQYDNRPEGENSARVPFELEGGA